MGDGRRPDEPLYISLARRGAEVDGLLDATPAVKLDKITVRCAALQAAAVLAAGGLTDAADDVVTEVTTVAEQFEQWLTR